ncbi:hypothetical protein [Persephonella sp.]
MENKLTKLYVQKKVKKYIEDLFTSKVEESKSNKEETKNKKSEEILKGEKKEKKFFEINTIFSVNVCGIYYFSKESILLTGDRNKLLFHTKEKKYRPILIYEIKENNKSVHFFALSLNRRAYRKKKIYFELKNCMFIRKVNCHIKEFPPRDTKNAKSFIFYRSVNRGGDFRKNQTALFSISLNVLNAMKNFKNLPNSKKYDAKVLCGFDYNYDLIIKCGRCKEKYIRNILNQIKEGRKNGRKHKSKGRNN